MWWGGTTSRQTGTNSLTDTAFTHEAEGDLIFCAGYDRYAKVVTNDQESASPLYRARVTCLLLRFMKWVKQRLVRGRSAEKKVAMPRRNRLECCLERESQDNPAVNDCLG